MDATNIGSFLQKLRKEDNLTQKDIAMLCNVTTQAVSKWERGDSIPDIEILEKLSILYKLSINELVNGQKKELYLDIDKRRSIISLTSSILVFFAYLLNFIKADYELDLGTTLIFKGYELIFNGVGGGIVVLSWTVFSILVSHLILNIFVLTKVIDHTAKIKNYFVYSSSVAMLIAILGIMIGAFIIFPQFIIIICLTVIIVMNYEDQYNLGKFAPFFRSKLDLFKDYRVEVKTYNKLRKNKGDLSTYFIHRDDRKNTYVALKINVILIIMLNLLLALTFGYFVMDSFFHPLEYTNFNELVFYTILYSVTWVVALYNYRYIKTIFGKNKLIFLAILLIAYPAIRLMMKILFETEYPMGIEVSLILLIQSITIFICSYKLSEK